MIRKIIAGLFVLFAAVQYNDPDFYLWVPAYVIVAFLLWYYDRSWLPMYWYGIATVLYLLLALYYVGDVISWFGDGAPSIAGSMKAETPFIEYVREFFGACLCLGACVYYLYQRRSTTS